MVVPLWQAPSRAASNFLEVQMTDERKPPKLAIVAAAGESVKDEDHRCWRQVGSPVAAFPGTLAVYALPDGSIETEQVLVWVAGESREVDRTSGTPIFSEWVLDAFGLCWCEELMMPASTAQNFLGYAAPGESLLHFIKAAQERAEDERAGRRER